MAILKKSLPTPPPSTDTSESRSFPCSGWRKEELEVIRVQAGQGCGPCRRKLGNGILQPGAWVEEGRSYSVGKQRGEGQELELENGFSY